MPRSEKTTKAAEAVAASVSNEAIVAYTITALPALPDAWQGYRFRKERFPALEADFTLQPRRAGKERLLVDRLPLRVQGEVGYRVKVRELTAEDLRREKGQVTEVPAAIPCVGDPEAKPGKGKEA